jgi:hypothetical protein
MAQDFGTPVDPIQQPRRNNTVIIIAVVVLLLLCCCCLLVIGAWTFFQPVFIDMWNTFSLSFAPWMALLH